ncbi:MAG TPA: CRISPR-associated endoribonuclease Cas6 [Clostridium sp.]|nr:CRISPR-associated endoribonuclease Cas6 [Clostridium sp.]
MNVYEITLKVYLLRSINVEEAQQKIAELIDKSLGKNSGLLDLHNKNIFKNYCFNSFYPIDKSGIYKADNIYTVKIRTISKDLGKYFNNVLANEYTDCIKGLVTDIRIIPKKHIEKIYSITPLILKNNDGYWKGSLGFEEFEKRVKENLIKKYNFINDEKLDENFDLYTFIEIKNKKPIATSYKGKRILGDKISIVISDDIRAQELAYMALGTGIGEMNARGQGFVNFRWL